MIVSTPSSALLRLSRKAVLLFGNGVNKYIGWLLPQCNISSNPYGGSTGTYGLINCIAIQNGAISAVVWFYMPNVGQGALLSFQNAQYAMTPSYTTPWLYVGTDGILRATDYAGGVWQVSTPSSLNPGWHMAVIEEWYSGGTYYLALYLDGSLVGLTTTTTLPQLFGANTNYQYNYIGTGYTTSSWPSTNNSWFFFNGAIAYIALYNRVLSSNEIQSIYQGQIVTNGLVSEFSMNNYNTSSNSLIDSVNNYVATPITPMTQGLIEFAPTEFASGINYELLAEKIAEKITSKVLNVNLPQDNTGNVKVVGLNLKADNYGYIYTDVAALGGNTIKLDANGFPLVDISGIGGQAIKVDATGYPYVDIGSLNGNAVPLDGSKYIYVDIGNISDNPLKSGAPILTNSTITSNGSSGPWSTFSYKNFLVTIYVGSVSGTSPSLTVYFNAYDGFSGQSIPIASATITSAGGTYIYVQDFAVNEFSISWVVGGTSPSFGSVYITVYESW
jgi:hypothetical protein